MSRCFPQLHTWREAAQVVQPNTLRLPSEETLRIHREHGLSVVLGANGSITAETFPCSNCGAPLAEHTHGPLVDGGCKRTGCKEYVP